MKRLIFIVLLLLYRISFAQNDTLRSIDELTDKFLENANETAEYSQIYSLFEYLLENPVNLKTASVNDLLKIPFLTYPVAKKITEYLKNHPGVNSVSFLDSLDWLDKETAENIKPFLSFGRTLPETGRKPNRKAGLQFRSRIQTDFQQRKGFTENKFAGTGIKNYNRLKINYGNKYRFTFLTEKDAGEKSYTDFTSANLTINGNGLFNKIVLGDYLIEFGQGLALWSPYAFSKSSVAVKTVTKRPRGLISYTSSDENRFFRGAGASINLEPLNFILFYSQNKLDASLNDDSSSVSSINVSGYHRTNSEISKKDILNEKNFGLMILLSPFTNFKIGYLFSHSEFSLPFYNNSIYKLNGNRFNFHSLSVDLYFNLLTLSSEVAYNSTSVASLVNVNFNLTKNFYLVFSFRNYPRNYYNLYANGFGERNNTQNEKGFYAGATWKNNLGELNFYYDQFYFPYSTYLNIFPSSGNEFMIDFKSRRFRSFIFGIRLKHEEKPKTSENKELTSITNTARTEFILRGKNYSSRTRFEIKFYDDKISPQEKGILLFQELNWQMFGKVKLSGRIVFFSTDSYETRLYEYERNVRGIFYNPALFGKGIRWYLAGKYRIFDFAELSFKYSETYKPFEKNLGSGYSEIDSNLDNSLIIQLEMIF